MANFVRTPSGYRKIHSLLITWQSDHDSKDRQPSINAVRDFQKALELESHFEVSQLRLHSTEPTEIDDALSNALDGLIRAAESENELMLIYYFGDAISTPCDCGHTAKITESSWYRHQNGYKRLQPTQAIECLSLCPWSTVNDSNDVPARSSCCLNILSHLRSAVNDVFLIMDCPSAYYLANANFSSVFANTDQTKEGNASKRPRRSFEILTAGYKKSEIQGPHLESNQDSPVPFFHNNDGIYYNGINPSLHHAYQAKASLTLRLTSAWRTLLSSNPLGFSTLQLVHKIRNVSYAFDAFPQLISILPDSRGYIVIAHATSSNIPGFVLPFFKYRTHVQLTGSDHVLFRERVIIHEHDFTQVLRVDLALDSPQIPNGHIVTAAIKRFRPRSQHERAEVLRVFEQERDNLLAISKWNHERIMELLGSFEVTDDNHGHLNLIFPYAEGGDLHNFMRLREAPEWLSEISKDKHGQDWFIYKEIIGLANAMAYVHRKDASGFVLHRDIKPANILIHKNQFKLADFGTARLKGGEETSKTDWDRGTKMYAAPERLLLDRHGRARDVWAFGCVILELMVLIAYGWTAAEQEDAMVDVFKEERRASNDEPNTTAFSHSMDCVNRWMTKMEKEDDTDGFIVKGTLLTVRDMLNIDPEQRPKSSTVAERLEDLE